MRFLAILPFLFTLAVAGAAAAPGGEKVYTSARAGLVVRLPTGWQVVHRRLTPCSDPREVLTVVGSGAMVMLQERVGGDDGLPARPIRFELRGKPQPMECCAPLDRAGWSIRFSEGGRGFYGFVYLGGRDTRTEALSILDSLRINRRRR